MASGVRFLTVCFAGAATKLINSSAVAPGQGWVSSGALAGGSGRRALSLNPPQGRASSRRTSRSIGCEGTLRRSNVVGVGRRRYVGGQLAFPDTVNWPLGAQDLRRG